MTTKQLVFLFCCLFSINSFAFCRSNKTKDISVSDLYEKTYETFANGKFRIAVTDPEAKIVDYYDSKSMSFSGVRIEEKTETAVDTRNKILQFFFPKDLTTTWFITVELSTSAMNDYVIGKNTLPLHFVMKHGGRDMRFTLVFNSDLSDNCRATNF